jgi:hypothetical protein
MRPIERKFLKTITEKGITRDNVLEFLDNIQPQELKKSFPDDCLFQTDKYFAKVILDDLIRYKMIRSEGNRYFKIETEKKEK